jgi:hypothetical protein
LRFLTCTFCLLADADYRGSIRVVLENGEARPITLAKGDSYFQLVVVQLHMGELERVDDIPDDTKRGQGGFGSTGNAPKLVIQSLPQQSAAAAAPVATAAGAGRTAAAGTPATTTAAAADADDDDDGDNDQPDEEEPMGDGTQHLE